MPPKHNILGILVSQTDYADATEQIIRAAQSRQPMAVTALAVHGVMEGVSDPEHKYRLNQFDLVCPDGQPVRWALNALHRCGLSDRVYGPTLTLRVCAAAAEAGVPIFLFGADEATLADLSESLVTQFKGLKIAGTKPSAFGKITEAEADALADEINRSGAGVCFVGLGCPRQEVFAYEMRDRINMPLIAVGAAFAFHAGRLAQAPPWMQRIGMEWFYRLVKEPRRLFHRYATTNPAYVAGVALQKIGWGRDPEDARKPGQPIRYG